MRKLISSLALAGALVVPITLHATPITGQFSIDGTVTNSGTTLTFAPGTTKTGVGTQTGTFATLLTDNELVTSGPGTLTYSPYSCCAVYTIGSLTATIESITATNFVAGGVPFTVFGGTALFAATGYDSTLGTFGFSTQGNSAVTFSATGTANSPIPEPSTLALFGSGALGLAGFVSRKFVALKS